MIDSLANLVGKKVYLYSGQNDTIVAHSVMLQVATQLRSLQASINSKFDLMSEHGWIVDTTTSQLIDLTMISAAVI